MDFPTLSCRTSPTRSRSASRPSSGLNPRQTMKPRNATRPDYSAQLAWRHSVSATIKASRWLRILRRGLRPTLISPVFSCKQYRLSSSDAGRPATATGHPRTGAMAAAAAAARAYEATRGGWGGPEQALPLILPGIVGEQVLTLRH